MKRIIIILRDGETIIGSPTLKDFAMLDDVMALHGIEITDIAGWRIGKVEE